jgi:hypothetical protein
MAPTVPACCGRVGLLVSTSNASHAKPFVYWRLRDVGKSALDRLDGLFCGSDCPSLKVPPLVGMIIVGVILGPQVGNVISPGVLDAANALRIIAVMVILMKAGLGTRPREAQATGNSGTAVRFFARCL